MNKPKKIKLTYEFDAAAYGSFNDPCYSSKEQMAKIVETFRRGEPVPCDLLDVPKEEMKEITTDDLLARSERDLILFLLDPGTDVNSLNPRFMKLVEVHVAEGETADGYAMYNNPPEKGRVICGKTLEDVIAEVNAE